MAYANTEKTRREIFKVAVIRLPSSLRYFRNNVEYKLITFMDAIKTEVTKHESPFSKPMSQKYKKKLKKKAQKAKKRS